MNQQEILSALYQMMLESDLFELGDAEHAACYNQRIKVVCRVMFGGQNEVADWRQATKEQVRRLFFAVGNPNIEWLAAAGKGAMGRQQFDRAFDRDEGRTLKGIVEGIRNLSGEADGQRALQLEEQFDEIVANPRRPLVFHRAIAALHPELVVPVPDLDKLNRFHNWLLNGVDQGNWFLASMRVRTHLMELLQGRTHYDVGAFAWFMTEAFRSDFNPQRQREDCERQNLVWNCLEANGFRRPDYLQR